MRKNGELNSTEPSGEEDYATNPSQDTLTEGAEKEETVVAGATTQIPSSS